jgi:hypothetical protein
MAKLNVLEHVLVALSKIASSNANSSIPSVNQIALRVHSHSIAIHAKKDITSRTENVLNVLITVSNALMQTVAMYAMQDSLLTKQQNNVLLGSNPSLQLQLLKQLFQ